MALFRRTNDAAEPTPEPVTEALPGARKDRPTPSRKQAEAARRQRVTQTYSKKEARLYAQREGRERRMKAITARESQPEKVLMRDYIDSRFNIGEYLLPSVVVILAVTVLGTYWPIIGQVATAVMYLFILSVIADGFLMWRGFKRLLAERMPKGSAPRPDDVRRDPRHPAPPLPDAGPPAQARRQVLTDPSRSVHGPRSRTVSGLG